MFGLSSSSMRHSALAIRDAVTLEWNEIQRDQRKKITRVTTARKDWHSRFCATSPECGR